MRALAWLRTAFVALFVVGLAGVVYLGDYYITQRATHADVSHVVPFAAHGDYVFLTRAEARDYYLLWAATIFAGLIGGWVSVVHDVRTGKVDRPNPVTASLVMSGFVLALVVCLYSAVTS